MWVLHAYAEILLSVRLSCIVIAQLRLKLKRCQFPYVFFERNVYFIHTKKLYSNVSQHIVIPVESCILWCVFLHGVLIAGWSDGM